jgi:hypothetical protein
MLLAVEAAADLDDLLNGVLADAQGDAASAAAYSVAATAPANLGLNPFSRSNGRGPSAYDLDKAVEEAAAASGGLDDGDDDLAPGGRAPPAGVAAAAARTEAAAAAPVAQQRARVRLAAQSTVAPSARAAAAGPPLASLMQVCAGCC